jgi:hypothetical protein
MLTINASPLAHRTASVSTKRSGKPTNYVGSALALLSLGAVCYLLGSLSRITSLTAHLDGKGTSVASTTWISKKCKTAPTPLDRSTVGHKTVLITGAASLIGYHLTTYAPLQPTPRRRTAARYSTHARLAGTVQRCWE